MNEIVWNTKALKKIRELSEETRKEIGFLLYQLQMGEKLKMPFSRPMPSLEKSCHELRVRDDKGIYRIFYYLKIKNQILVFHVFQKKTEETPKQELELGRKLLQELLNEKN